MSAPVLDWLVVTAANAGQARAYEAQLAARERAGALRAVLGQVGEEGSGQWLVVPDAKDQRIGSGGSTLMVLHELAVRLARKAKREKSARAGTGGSETGVTRSITQLFQGQRILIIHSGGDAKRLPAYAAQGKVFTPLPTETHDGRAADLFDLVFEDLVAVMPGSTTSGVEPRAGRAVIASGDLYLGLAGRNVDGSARNEAGAGASSAALQQALAQPGVVGVACPSGMDRASRHGVFVRDAAARVTDFLQKPSAAEAAARGAIDGHGLVLVDTGVVSLDPPSVERWLCSAGISWNAGRVRVGDGLVKDMQRGRGMAVDLYQHVMMALAAKDSVEKYLQDVGLSDARKDKERAACTRLYEALKGSEFHVAVVTGCEFLHIGTTREFLEIVTGPRWTSQPHHRASATRQTHGATSSAVVYNSATGNIKSTGKAVVEGCSVEHARLGGENVVVSVTRPTSVALELPRGWGMVCLPVGKRDWAAVAFGIDDDPKKNIGEARFGGEVMKAWMKRAAIEESDLWLDEAGDRSLWTARMWTTGRAEDVLDDAAWMMKRRRAPKSWLRAKRSSMAEIMARVDHERLIEQRAELRRRAEARQVGARLLADPWMSASRAADGIETVVDALRAMGELWAAADRARRAGDELEAARLLRACAVIKERARAVVKRGELAAGVGALQASPDWNREAFAAVARSVARTADARRRISQAVKRPGVLPDQVVWVTAPVRIDLAGGWSDTPPICQELGGSVVNAAITLNGQYPVQVMVRLAEQRNVRISSVDLGKTVTLTDAASVQDYTDPHDWTALAKAALVLSGLVPSMRRSGVRFPSLTKHLEPFGGGIDITMFSALPKGSGLGTSSVLGAALLAALDRFAGRDIDRLGLIRRTSVLEQMMSTAGGWQDQVGGITPGVKMLRTKPGPDQTPVIERIESPLVDVSSPTGGFNTTGAFASDLSSRVLLYYTGYRRLARDILQKVVARYLARDHGIVEIVHRLKTGAEEVRAALAAGDAEGFARGVAAYWELKKAIDPGSTNERIEAIVGRVDKCLNAYELPGAGGGGFIFMIARDEEAALKVRTELERKPPNQLARFYDFAIDQKGLSVAVL